MSRLQMIVSSQTGNGFHEETRIDGETIRGLMFIADRDFPKKAISIRASFTSDGVEHGHGKGRIEAWRDCTTVNRWEFR